ncbi:MAG: alginate lyase family protein [Planctomycetota bacterium]|jgi:hypothetical protein
MTIIQKITIAFQIMRNCGIGFCAYRTKYALMKKSGILKRRFPIRRWSDVTLSEWLKPTVETQPEAFLQLHRNNGRHFFFDDRNLSGLNKNYVNMIVCETDKVLRNRFRYFFDKSYDLGTKPDWFLNPVTGKRAKSDLHWCDISIFDPDVGDIKFIWEPSRFAWAYSLIRAFAATGDNKYADKFWSLFESWLEANPPNSGPNYACGQECAIRLMAMCFAFYALNQAPASTDQRKIKLICAIAFHADRIEKNIDFAISTRTNHSLTEAAGLYTAGILFPEFTSSDYWIKTGKRILTNEGLKQISPDGSYIQHSMNYHRLMLQDFLWVIRLGQLNKDLFSEKLTSHVVNAVEFIYQMQDSNNGRVPNYGANDGAVIIPLNSCDYLDFRPVIQSAHYLFDKSRIYEPGPWDEDLLWFFGPQALTAPLKILNRQSVACHERGYYTLRNKHSWAMMRCHTYKERPVHSDMLHLDLWWKGVNILRDSGTYMCYVDEPWQNFFVSSTAHNTVVIDGINQMTKGSRFMWFEWVKSKLMVHRSFNDGFIKVMQGEHYGYSRSGIGAVHRRAVLSLDAICWLIVDDVLGTGIHNVGLNWQLSDVNFECAGDSVILKTQHGPAYLTVSKLRARGSCECVKGEENGAGGWQSLYYGNREATGRFAFYGDWQLPVRLITLISLNESAQEISLTESNTVSWVTGKSAGKYVVGLKPIDDGKGNIFAFGQKDSTKVILD